MAKGITTNLWFDNCAKEAVDFYLSVFNDGRILSVDYYTDSSQEVTGHAEGDVLAVAFELRGMHFIAINGGPQFSFNPSVSFMVECDNQAEIDAYWDRLSSDPAAEQCGWLRDKYGLSWQIVPSVLNDLLKRGTPEQRLRVTDAFMRMKKFVIKDLESAFNA
jgi:predicted 3-demethylubiquinone-9 3-methyltransferase (glyoxalase superfamily)